MTQYGCAKMDIAEQFDIHIRSSIVETNEQFTSDHNNIFNVSKLNLSTMTLYYRSNIPIDIMNLKTHSIDIMTKLTEVGIDIKTIDFSDKFFKNARIIQYKDIDNNRKCCLIFKDGGIQVKGCKSAVQGMHIANAILQGIHKKDIMVSQMQVVLMNANFSIGKYISLHHLHTHLIERNENATYDKERRCGINLKLKNGEDKDTTCMIFKRGHVTIMGAKSVAEVVASCTTIVKLLVDTSHDVVKEDVIEKVPDLPKKRGRKRKADVDALYSSIAL
jgi:TATA-box binding protein (TBP) (component of TFIID and TFIIIB)